MAEQSGSKSYTQADSSVRKMFFVLDSAGVASIRAEPNTLFVKTTAAQRAALAANLPSSPGDALISSVDVVYVADGGELGGRVEVKSGGIAWRQSSGSAIVEALTAEMVGDVIAFLGDANALIDGLV